MIYGAVSSSTSDLIRLDPTLNVTDAGGVRAEEGCLVLPS